MEACGRGGFLNGMRTPVPVDRLCTFIAHNLGMDNIQYTLSMQYILNIGSKEENIRTMTVQRPWSATLTRSVF